jgi:hypothetical protein
MEDENGEAFSGAKRDGFQPFMKVPTRDSAKFELALNINNVPTRASAH